MILFLLQKIPTLSESETDPNPKKLSLFTKSAIFCLVLFFLIAISGFFFFSKVEIKIWPKTEILTSEEKLTIDLNTGVKIFSSQKSASRDFSVSGKLIKKEKAAGTIKVYNAYSTSPRSLVPSRFVSADGKLFWSIDKVTIPGAREEKGKFIPGEAEIRVRAAEPGEEYNIGPTTFALPALAGSPLYTTIYGKSFSPMAGGFIGEVAQVTKEDIEKAENILIEDLKKEDRDSLKTILPEGFVLLEETISQEIIETKSSVEAGAEAESFSLQAGIKSEGFGFKKSDLEDFAKNHIILNITENKKLKEGSLEVNYSLESKDLELGKLVLDLDIKAKIYLDINTENLKKALLGKTLKEARIYLENLSQVDKIELKSKPFLKKKIPEDMKRVEIKLEID